MALPVMAGLSAGQAMANAPETSLRPEPRPDHLLQNHEVSPKQVTDAASPLFMQIYEPKATAQLAERMNATLGPGDHRAMVLNWDGIELDDYSRAELDRLYFEIEKFETYERSPHDVNRFEAYKTLSENPDFTGMYSNLTDEQLKENLARFQRSELRDTVLANGDKLAVSQFGANSSIETLPQFISISLPKTEAQMAADNEFTDDYIMRHENCHGIDPAVYMSVEQFGEYDDFTYMVDENVSMNLRANYAMYMYEQFADACVTLEYAIEGNTEAFEKMETIALYRDAGMGNSLGTHLSTARTHAARNNTTPSQELAPRLDSYFNHHDTGNSIRAMMDYSQRLSSIDKAILQANPGEFVEFVQDVIQKSAMTPDEYMLMIDDAMALAESKGEVKMGDLSPQTQELIDRHFAGERRVIENNLQVPYGSIDALREAAPKATQNQRREAILLDQDGQSSLAPLLMGSETIQSLDLQDRILFAHSYTTTMAYDAYSDLRVLESSIQRGHMDVEPHQDTFHFRNAGLITQEAGKYMDEIADPNFDKDTFEVEQPQLPTFELKL